jgi:hypothetical protein
MEHGKYSTSSTQAVIMSNSDVMTRSVLSFHVRHTVERRKWMQDSPSRTSSNRSIQQCVSAVSHYHSDREKEVL